MSIGWIYALSDRGFDRGVKVGRDKNHPVRYRRSQCYTPRGIDLVAAWKIDAGFDSLSQAEAVARRGLPSVINANCGAEWCALSQREAIERVSANLALDPVPHAGNPEITTTYDDFRDPKILGREANRQILWIYRENVTNIVKVQRTCSWKVPQEPVKTYSLLGFRPVACFGLFTEADLSVGNRRIDELWAECVTDLGYGVNHTQVGWLRPEVHIEELYRRARARSMTAITDWGRCPQGVRPGY